MRLTLTMLRELGSCGEYLRKFGNAFPESQYPQGVTLDQETCVQHYRDFDWSWAMDVMLSHDGQLEWNRLVRSRTAEHRRQFGTGDERRAAVFGHLIATEPQFRSRRLIDVSRSAEERAANRIINELSSFESYVRDAEQSVQYHQRNLEAAQRSLTEYTEKVASLQEQVGPARRVIAEREAERAAQQVTDTEASLVRLRQTAERAAAQARELAAQFPTAGELAAQEAAATVAAAGDLGTEPEADAAATVDAAAVGGDTGTADGVDAAVTDGESTEVPVELALVSA